jgi:hypothetical protein
VDHLVKKAIGIHLNKNNFNRDGGYILSQAWSPITNTLVNSISVINVHALINISYVYNIYYMNVSELKRRTEQSKHSTPPIIPVVLPPSLRGKCITVHGILE